MSRALLLLFAALLVCLSLSLFGEDFIALRYGKCAAGTEVVLHIDYEEDVAVADCVSFGQFSLLVFLRWCLVS